MGSPQAADEGPWEEITRGGGHDPRGCGGAVAPKDVPGSCVANSGPAGATVAAGIALSGPIVPCDLV